MSAIFSHVVLHQFDVAGKTVQPGDQVNATDWKNTERLVSCKYLRPATPADLARSTQNVGGKQTSPVSPVTRKLKKLVIKRK